jgi:hypothetical protein
VVLVKPRSFSIAFSIFASSAFVLRNGLSKRTLPLEITVCTFCRPSSSKAQRSFSLRMFGFAGLIPRRSATYLID